MRRWLAAVLLALSAPVDAQLAHTRDAVNVRAGPDRMFPVVTWLPARNPLHVAGCTADGRWCDVVAGRTRGWIAASYLSQPFASRQAPVVTFSVRDYWAAHYARRPWQADADRWADWDKPGFVPPAPVNPGRRG
ncbi:MAG: SH3 domain-containing protein [Burkholderiales bacterium]